MNPLKIFIVDDQEILRVSLSDELIDSGFNVHSFSNAEEAIEKIDSLKPDAIVTDIKMPGKSGLELLKIVSERNENIKVVLMTSYGSIKSAVDAMKSGAYDYITKPFDTQDLIIRLNRISEFNYLSNYVELTNKQQQEEFDYSSFIGNSNSVKNLFDLVQKIINTDTTVLVNGETGTGKELLTNIIHYNSNRKNKPFVKVSCAILSKEIFESELFGHEKGAFTGAGKLKKGRFELADTGTIYLDDVDDIPIDLQVKLLRVLEQREFERVGSSEPVKIDVRVIASTKADIRKLVDEGKFREDLFYRLNIFPLNIPPLRERLEDVELLSSCFAVKFGKRDSVISKDIINKFKSYSWPGNVRELKNIIERLTLISGESVNDPELLPKEFQNTELISEPDSENKLSLDEKLSEIEKNYILHAIKTADGNKTAAAKKLGIPLSTLRTKMEKYKI